MTEYNRVRLAGNPIRAFEIDRAEGPAQQRPLSPAVLASREEERRIEEARRIRVQLVREARLTFRSNMDYFAALRRAEAGGEIEETGGEE